MFSKKLYIICICLFSLFILDPIFVGANSNNALRLQTKEAYGVHLPNIRVNMNKNSYVINVDLEWGFRTNPSTNDYIDSNLIVNDMKNFLKNYPNPADYWEIINHKLGIYLLNKYPALAFITIKLQILPSKLDDYLHYSVVTATR